MDTSAKSLTCCLLQPYQLRLLDAPDADFQLSTSEPITTAPPLDSILNTPSLDGVSLARSLLQPRSMNIGRGDCWGFSQPSSAT
ncbi:hypothetical protein PSEUDO9AG_40114 [Pseudomonas sp. 9Ag]|nr:hypothetical protein PSEUDO9AG_40114 [Pseudomonas sp. 9Ag]